MRTVLDLPPLLLRQLERQAALEGLPIEQMICDTIAHGLAQRRSDTPKAKRSRSGLPTIEIGRPLGIARFTNADLVELIS